jgi:hypothetical protein
MASRKMHLDGKPTGLSPADLPLFAEPVAYLTLSILPTHAYAERRGAELPVSCGFEPPASRRGAVASGCTGRAYAVPYSACLVITAPVLPDGRGRAEGRLCPVWPGLE